MLLVYVNKIIKF